MVKLKIAANGLKPLTSTRQVLGIQIATYEPAAGGDQF
jgi:hypothetical protein